MKECTHQDQIVIVRPEGYPAGCEDCLKIGSWWVHLRHCLACGHVGCCDSSPNRHARQHSKQAEHAIVQSAERGESWIYCFVDDIVMEGPPPLS